MQTCKQTKRLISENISPAFADHRLKTNAPNDWIIFKIHYSIIRNARHTLITIRIRVQQSKHICRCRHNNRHRFTNNMLGFMLNSLFAILSSVTKIPTNTALSIQQNGTHHVASAILNIVAIEAILGSIEADFAEHFKALALALEFMTTYHI